MTTRKSASGVTKACGLEVERTGRAKLPRSKHGDRSFSYVGRGGKVALPPNFADLRLGQRLYFCFIGRGIVLSLRPRGLCKGRLLSTRVRQAVRSLACYGPRARKSSMGI